MLESVVVKFSPNLWDFLVGGALVALSWTGSVVAVLLAVIAFLLYLLVRYQFRSTPKSGIVRATLSSTESFVVEAPPHGKFVLQLDFQPGHFREVACHDILSWKKLYEYQIDQHEVLYRLIESEVAAAGDPNEHDVRDGVVQESEIRARGKYKQFSWKNADEDIAELNKEVEWKKMEPNILDGFKYFILSKKLPNPDIRRYFRQELERLKIGTARFYKEAERYGLEPDETPERFHVVDGKPRPSNEEYQQLYQSCSSFGITELEFDSEKKLTAVLKKLLGD